MVRVTHIDNKKAFTANDTAGTDYLAAIREKLATDRAVNRKYAHKLHPLDDKQAIIFDGAVKSVLVRKPIDGQKCVIDWLNVVLDARAFYPKDDILNGVKYTSFEKQTLAVKAIGKILFKIIGFGLDCENLNGRNFYERSFNLEHQSGFICIGGQKDTILITINGTGCTYAREDWEVEMCDWLGSLNAKITRLDIAYDNLKPNVLSVDYFDNLHSIGGFCSGGRNPNIEYRGNWKKPNGKGRTIYIGSRQSDKFCRIYERGKMLGNKDSKWLRVEIEFKNRDTFIPFDALIYPTDYFVAAYPCFEIIEELQFYTRFQKKQKEEFITFERAEEILKTQFGRYLLFFRKCYQDDKALLDTLTDITNTDTPERLDILTIPKNLTPATDILAMIEQEKRQRENKQDADNIPFNLG